MKVKFKTNARTVNLLGRDNVLDHDSAIIELIKNAYDAQSSKVLLDFEDDKIVIADNGSGMTLDTIEKVFFTLGTDYKLKQRFSLPVNGSMGIGRLALGRIGNKTEITTCDSSKAYNFSIDWTVFESNYDLSEINFNIYEINLDDFNHYAQQYFNNKNVFSGTIIKCTDLLEKWGNEGEDSVDLKFLKQKLENLTTPFNEDAFKIYLRYKGNSELIKQSQTIKFDSKIEFIFDGLTKNIKYKILSNEFKIDNISADFLDMIIDKNPELSKYIIDKSGNLKSAYTRENEILVHDYLTDMKNIPEKLSKLSTDSLRELLKNIGDFSGIFYFTRKQNANKTSPTFLTDHSLNSVERKNKNKGISLYRDSFRIRPYGEFNTVGFDWLGIESIRSINPAGVNRPGYIMQANQLYGYVSFKKDDNPDFQDQANREGIRFSKEFEVFKYLLLYILKEFSRSRSLLLEQYQMYDDSNIIKEAKTTNINRVFNQIEALAKMNDMNVTLLKNDPTLLKLVKVDSIVDLYVKTKFVSVKNSELLDEVELLQALSTQAISMSFFAHEIKNSKVYFSRFNSMLKEIEDEYAKRYNIEYSKLDSDLNLSSFRTNTAKRISYISGFLDVTLRNPKRSRQSKELLYEYLESLLAEWEKLMVTQAYSYTFKLINRNLNDDLLSTMVGHSTQFDSIFINLITNSLKAFKKSKQEERKIVIVLEEIQGRKSILYQDNGPGLDMKNPQISINPNVIFEPYFTTGNSKKSIEGKNIRNSGMGLWILSSAIDKLGWKKELILDQKGFMLRIWL